MFLDGLEDAYDKGRAMGTFAEECADTYGFTREEQDAYALRSLDRAKTAIETGAFDGEIVAVGDVTTDEQPGRARPEKIPTLKPAFRDGGTVTAANSSSISDGAAALVLTRKSQAEAMGLTPIAVIHGHAGHAQAPSLFTTAPIPAMQKVLAKVGWTVDDVDLFEINEAFAVVAMAAIRDLGLDDSKVNVNGGACALGHPIGCSGARIVVTLIAALQARGLKKGVASLCIGGGEATALAVELL
jgi:acetyl-CoA C-acetyltransferase